MNPNFSAIKTETHFAKLLKCFQVFSDFFSKKLTENLYLSLPWESNSSSHWKFTRTLAFIFLSVWVAKARKFFRFFSSIYNDNFKTLNSKISLIYIGKHICRVKLIHGWNSFRKFQGCFFFFFLLFPWEKHLKFWLYFISRGQQSSLSLAQSTSLWGEEFFISCSVFWIKVSFNYCDLETCSW